MPNDRLRHNKRVNHYSQTSSFSLTCAGDKRSCFLKNKKAALCGNAVITDCNRFAMTESAQPWIDQ